MFAILGFIACLFVLGYMSLVWVLLALNGLGTYTIGGVPNTVGGRTVIIALAALLGYFWYLLFAAGPISVVIK